MNAGQFPSFLVRNCAQWGGGAGSSEGRIGLFKWGAASSEGRRELFKWDAASEGRSGCAVSSGGSREERSLAFRRGALRWRCGK